MRPVEKGQKGYIKTGCLNGFQRSVPSGMTDSDRHLSCAAERRKAGIPAAIPPLSSRKVKPKIESKGMFHVIPIKHQSQ